MFPFLEQSVQTLIYYPCLAQRAADLAYVRLLILTARFKQSSVGSGSPLVVFGFRVVREGKEVREVTEVREVKKAGEVGEAWVVMGVRLVFRKKLHNCLEMPPELNQ